MGQGKLNLYKTFSPVLYRISPSARNGLMDMLLYKSNKIEDMKSPKIKEAVLRISEKCNLRCPMCWWWGENGTGFKDVQSGSPRIFKELSKREWFSIIDQLATFNSSAEIIGGEPFVRKDALEIVKYASSKLRSVSIVTNGTLIDDNAALELSKISNLEITFSIDGPREIHDQIRGKGNYDRTTDVIRKILSLRGKNRFPMILTNTTITPYGIEEIPTIVQQLEELGVDIIKMQHLWFTDEQTASFHVQEIERRLNVKDKGCYSHLMKMPSIDDLQRLSKVLSEIESKRHKVPVLIKPRLTKNEVIKYYTDLSFKKLDNCPVAWQTIRIESDGNVIFCPDEWIGNYKIGNIRKNSIKEIWNGQLAQKFRDSLNGEGLFPACSRCCVLNL